MTVAARRAHAYQLARTLEADIVERPRMSRRQSFAVPNARIVVVRGVETEAEYAVVLHELGHVACGGSVFGLSGVAPLDALRVDEAKAWRWARTNAAVWTRRMSVCAATALWSYVNPANETQYPELRLWDETRHPELRLWGQSRPRDAQKELRLHWRVVLTFGLDRVALSRRDRGILDDVCRWYEADGNRQIPEQNRGN